MRIRRMAIIEDDFESIYRSNSEHRSNASRFHSHRIECFYLKQLNHFVICFAANTFVIWFASHFQLEKLCCSQFTHDGFSPRKLAVASRNAEWHDEVERNHELVFFLLKNVLQTRQTTSMGLRHIAKWDFSHFTSK